MKGWLSGLGATLAAGALVAPLHAQTAPFEVNPDRVSYTGGKSCKQTTFVIPSYYLYVEGRNTTNVRDGNVSAKSRVFIDGYTNAMLQGLARDLYDDLVAKLRAAGATVITYDEIKAETAGFDRQKVDPKIGAPTRDTRARPGHDFIIATPSDAQMFAVGRLGPSPFYPVMKARNATMLMPELWLTLPQMVGKKEGGLYSAAVGVYGSPAMKLTVFTSSGTSATKWCAMFIDEHGMRLAADDVGEFQKLGENKIDWGNWGRSRADFSFVIDPARFHAGVMRVGTAVNAYLTRTQMTGK